MQHMLRNICCILKNGGYIDRMPPKAKYSKQEIIEKAVEIIGESGYEKLTARELASTLGTSVKPIFTAFENMEEVKQECFNFAFQKYHSYFKDGLGEYPLKTIGFNYIKFARNEPNLFKIIFLKSQETELSFGEYMQKLDDEYENSLKLVMDYSGFNKEKSFELYKNLWIYSTGIASLCATKQCKFTDDEINQMLDLAYTGLINTIKGEN